MSGEILIKGLIAAIYSGLFSWVIYAGRDREQANPERQRYTPYISGVILPTFILVLAAAALIYYGGRTAAQMTLSVCFGIFLHIGLYFVVLIPLLPLLRRHFSARACAMLWMLPNYLYLTQQRYMQLPMPLLVIRVPGQLVWGLFGLWLGGFAGVLGWNILSHLRFRRNLLKEAEQVTDPEILAIWDREIAHAKLKKPKIKLMYSANIASPLTIGLIKRKIRVLLPVTTYSPEALGLIFRHEIVHIGREDAWSKFFLVFCTAMCWFNPLMWSARKKSTEDLELSCDETVLENADNSTRYQYAELLIKTAGDARGFSTCLSASAASMRYRLKNIVKPPRKNSGTLLVGMVFFVLCMSCGYTALAYDQSSGAEQIYQSRDASAYSLRSISPLDDSYHTTWTCRDEEAFHNYMASLELEQLTGNYSFTGSQKELVFLYDTPKGVLAVELRDKAVKIVPLYGKEHVDAWYYLPGGIDWDYLRTILIPNPSLLLHFRKQDNSDGNEITASLYSLEEIKNGEAAVLLTQEGAKEYEPNGIYGDFEADNVTLDFSHTVCYTLCPGIRVEVEALDRTIRYTLDEADLRQPDVLPLADFDARYTISARLLGEDGTAYRAVFQFALGTSGL